MPSLMWLFVTPFITAIIAFFIPCKRFAFLLSLLPLVLLLLFGPLAFLDKQVHFQWLPSLLINFHLKADALSLIFVYLTAIIVPISILAVDKKSSSAKLFFGLILLTQGLLIGFFTAADLVVFTIFWESILFPLYFLIVLAGGEMHRLVGLKFLIYMIAGSAFMISAVLALFFVSQSFNGVSTFNIESLRLSLAVPYAALVALIFLLAFAVKTPLFPFHGWLPDTYTLAPTAATILLAALLSKAGIYGILRIGLGIFPEIIYHYSPVLIALAITGVFYAGLAAWRQKDFKRLIAYSSLSHVNFILVGLFVASDVAHYGAALQALNHGIVITGLFLVANWLEQRLGHRAIGVTSGLAEYMPRLCWLTLFFVLASVALPGTNSFIGELLIFFGLFQLYPYVAAFLGFSVILSVIYMLRFMQKVYFEKPSEYHSSYVDISAKHLLIAAPLILCILAVGLYPSAVLHLIESIPFLKIA